MSAVEAESAEFDHSRFGQRAQRIWRREAEEGDAFDMHASIISSARLSIGTRIGDGEPWLRIVDVTCKFYPSNPAGALTATMMAEGIAEMRRKAPLFSRKLGSRSKCLALVAQSGAGAGLAGAATTLWVDWGQLLMWVALIASSGFCGAAVGRLWYMHRAKRRLLAGVCPVCLYPLNPFRRCSECGFSAHNPVSGGWH